MLYLRDDCKWVIPFLADPKDEGTTPVGIYPNYLPFERWTGGSVETVGGKEGI